jgi:hypothetical protein
MSDPRARTISANEFQVQMPTANLFAWYLSSQAYTAANGGGSLITTDATSVNSLKDMSGNGYHLNAGNSPQYKVNQLGTYPGILFNGNYLQKTSYNLAAPYTTYYVFSAAANNGAVNFCFDTSTGNPYFDVVTAGGSSQTFGNGLRFGFINPNYYAQIPAVWGITNFHIVTAALSSSKIWGSVDNNVANQPSASLTALQISTLTLGAYGNGGSTSNCNFVEVLVYSAIHDPFSGDGATVLRYLNQKYGLGLIW